MFLLEHTPPFQWKVVGVVGSHHSHHSHLFTIPFFIPTSHRLAAPPDPRRPSLVGDRQMSEAGEADRAAAALPPAAKRSRAGRMDFSKDPRFERLVPIFGVDSVSDFNKDMYRLANFQQMAAALETRATGVTCKPGKYRSWMDAIDACIKHASHHRPEDLQLLPRAEPVAAPADPAVPPVAARAADEQEPPDNEDDALMVQALTLIDQLAAGEELSEDAISNLDDSLIDKCVQVLSRRCDDLEAGARASLEALSSEDVSK